MKSDNQKFREYMDSLTVADHRAMVDEIVKQCIVPRQKIYMWKNGAVKIAPIYKKIITEIIGKDIFE